MRAGGFTSTGKMFSMRSLRKDESTGKHKVRENERGISEGMFLGEIRRKTPRVCPGIGRSCYGYHWKRRGEERKEMCTKTVLGCQSARRMGRGRVCVQYLCVFLLDETKILLE